MKLRVLVFLLVCSLFASAPSGAAERLLVFAAASQRDALLEIGARYEERCDCKIAFSFAATSTLARQIDAGAGADAFISANTAWADWLEIRGRTIRESRAVIAGNRLVIASAAPKGAGLALLERGRFAMADPVSVPAGIYAREALQSEGIWDRIRKNAVYSENVRVALVSVKRGDLLAGIVYQSDLMTSPELDTGYVFAEGSHSPVRYVAAAVRGSATGAGFVAFLSSEVAQQIFRRFGFLTISDTEQG